MNAHYETKDLGRVFIKLGVRFLWGFFEHHPKGPNAAQRDPENASKNGQNS